MILVQLLWLAVLGVAVLAVGCWLWPRGRSDRSGPAGTLLGGAELGLALATVGLYLCASWRLDSFWWCWLPLGVFAAWRLLRATGGPGCAAGWPRGAGAVLAVLLLVLASRLLLVPLHPLPPGWDPSFHLLLAGRVLESNRLIADWQPFSPTLLNYPLGLHLWLAALARITGLGLPTLFLLGFAPVAALTAAQVARLAWRVGGDLRLAAAAAFAYGLLAVYGSIGYVDWGGLPNALAMSFFLANLNLLLGPRFGRREWLWFALLHGATCLVHHHVMVTAGLCYLALAGWLAWRRDWGRVRGLFAGLALSLLPAAPVVLPMLLRYGQLGQTKVFQFTEPFFGPRLLLASLGWAFALLALAGLAAGWRRWRRWPGVGLPVTVLATLTLLFAACSYGYRGWARARYGQDYVAFTASRFLTDMAPFLALFAGLALLGLRERLRLPAAAAWAAAALLAASNYPVWRNLAHSQLDRGQLAAFAWVREQAPPQARILSSHQWAAFCTWRACDYVPIPISEPVREAVPWMATVQRQLRRELPWEPGAVVWAVAPDRRLSPRLPRLWRDPASDWSVVAVSSEQ